MEILKPVNRFSSCFCCTRFICRLCMFILVEGRPVGFSMNWENRN